MAGRNLDFRIGDGFGGANSADITAVLRSAAEAVWQHCLNTRWEVPGFYIYHSDASPITGFDHHADGRIQIGLTPQGNLWAQFAYQFSHEFCHALAGHTNDWHQPWIRGRKANHWLEESICETASVFCLRAMGKSWQTNPPYPNWKSYATHLTTYAEDRLAEVKQSQGADFQFPRWFQENEPALRKNATDRPKNNIVAAALLPIFEATPAGWEAMTAFNLGTNRDAEKSLARHFADWSAAAPEAQRKFIHQLAEVFSIKL